MGYQNPYCSVYSVEQSRISCGLSRKGCHHWCNLNLNKLKSVFFPRPQVVLKHINSLLVRINGG